MTRILIINDQGIKGAGTENRIKLLIEKLLKIRYFDKIHLLEHECSNSPEINELQIHKCTTQNSDEVTEKIIKDNYIDIVQVHNLSAISIRPIKIAKKLKKPIIFSAHDQWGYCGRRVLINKNEEICNGPGLLKCISCIGIKNFLNIQKDKFYLNKCDVGIAPSQFVINLYKKNEILKQRWKKVFPWNIIKTSINSGNREKFFLYVGGAYHYKGIFCLLDAMNYVVKKHPKIKLKIAGPGDFSTIKEQYTSLTNNLEFLGYLSKDDVEKLMNKCYAFIMPSVCEESSSFSVIQAMSLGCSIISASSGGVPEILEDCGLIFKKNDALELSEKMDFLINNVDLIKEYGRNAREKALREFDLNNVHNIIKIYEDILKKY